MGRREKKVRCWWWTRRPCMLQSMRLQRVRQDWATELNWTLEICDQAVFFSGDAISLLGMHAFQHLASLALSNTYIIDCDDQKCSPQNFQVPSRERIHSQLRNTGDQSQDYGMLFFSNSGTGRKQAEIWVDKCYVWQIRTLMEERDRGTESVCHGLVMTVRFTEQQSMLVGPGKLYNTIVVEDPWPLFVHIWTSDWFLAIVNKVQWILLYVFLGRHMYSFLLGIYPRWIWWITENMLSIQYVIHSISIEYLIQLKTSAHFFKSCTYIDLWLSHSVPSIYPREIGIYPHKGLYINVHSFICNSKTPETTQTFTSRWPHQQIEV